jgi:hypothetical protein
VQVAETIGSVPPGRQTLSDTTEKSPAPTLDEGSHGGCADCVEDPAPPPSLSDTTRTIPAPTPDEASHGGCADCVTAAALSTLGRRLTLSFTLAPRMTTQQLAAHVYVDLDSDARSYTPDQAALDTLRTTGRAEWTLPDGTPLVTQMFVGLTCAPNGGERYHRVL